MTAEGIRNSLNLNRATWRGAKIYTGSHGARDLILVEIAAQLAELNENLRAAKPVPDSGAQPKDGRTDTK